ncbi:hypothetical protein PILCRDRAFT_4963 [Piloderma croceum F 1598]|uniref:Uncharacterized protein n=1 Tax=Piloderma croceum (strain F 1598) TaxID=765440 RepID=A0A0C3FQS2_PILCF|nr:hypothetical protein PILCRDRAFT_4963 [Piloderma croceum F 1598]
MSSNTSINEETGANGPAEEDTSKCRPYVQKDLDVKTNVMLVRMIKRQPGVWPDNVLGKWGSKNFHKKEMEGALKNNVYGFSTTNPLPKAIANTRDTGKSSKMQGKHVVGLQKELDVQQAIEDGMVKPSALADELKLHGVSTVIPTLAIAKAATSNSVIAPTNTVPGIVQLHQSMYPNCNVY